MQKWEYLWLLRSRSAELGKDGKYYFPSNWKIQILTKAERKEWQGDPVDLLAQLGEEGWELAATWVRSDEVGGMQLIKGVIDTPNFSNQTSGTIEGKTMDFAGFSTTEHWVFKRSNA